MRVRSPPLAPRDCVTLGRRAFAPRPAYPPWLIGVEAFLAHDNKHLYIVIMIRTQISLPEEEYEAAKEEASKLGISLAELLRRSLRTVLRVDESKPWMRYAGIVESGDPNSSHNIDDVVYGQKD